MSSRPKSQSNPIYACRFCGKEYAHRSTRSKHERHNCKNKSTSDYLSPKSHIASYDAEHNSVIPVSQASNLNDLEPALAPVPLKVEQKEELNNTVNINYVLPRQNYWEILKEKKGITGALQFLHRCADLKLGGDILLFEELFLPQNDKASWPVERKQGSNKELILKEPDGTIIDECASKIIYDRFVTNYKDALLEGSNQILSILVSPEEVERELREQQRKIEIRGKIKNISSDELETAYTSIFQDYDFGMFQDRAYLVQHEHPKPHSKFSEGLIKSNF